MLKSWIAGLIILNIIRKMNDIAMHVFMVYVFVCILIELNLYTDLDSRINPFQIEELRGCPAFEVL